MKLDIFECQPGKFCRPSSDATQEGYKFIGRYAGLWEFETRHGKIELFARRRLAPASWHLKRGFYCFEFVRSA